MSDVSTAPANNQTVSRWILLGRHIVVLSMVLAVYSKISSAAADDFFVFWPAVCAMVFTVSAVIAGLGMLFFTNSERGKSVTTFRNAAWVLSALLFVDPLARIIDLKAVGRPGVSAEHRPALQSSGAVAMVDATASPKVDAAGAVAPPTVQESNEACPNRSSEGSAARAAKLASVRRDFPTTADLDDAAVVRAMHEAFYKDLPLECIADALGVVMPTAQAR